MFDVKSDFKTQQLRQTYDCQLRNRRKGGGDISLLALAAYWKAEPKVVELDFP